MDTGVVMLSVIYAERSYAQCHYVDLFEKKRERETCKHLFPSTINQCSNKTMLQGLPPLRRDGVQEHPGVDAIKLFLPRHLDSVSPALATNGRLGYSA